MRFAFHCAQLWLLTCSLRLRGVPLGFTRTPFLDQLDRQTEESVLINDRVSVVAA